MLRRLSVRLQFSPPGQARLTIGEIRQRIQTLQGRNSSGPMSVVKLIEARMVLVHLLAQTGRSKDQIECLQLGEEMWKEFAEENKLLPAGGGSGPTKGLALHLCTTMRHTAKAMGDPTRAAMWVQRLGALHETFMNPNAEDPLAIDPSSPTPDGQGEEPQGELDKDGQPKLGSCIRKFELDERGVRKNTKWKTGNGVGDSFKGLRHPLMDLPFQRAQKGYKPNPDAGPRY
jgi:hypothetical protein